MLYISRTLFSCLLHIFVMCSVSPFLYFLSCDVLNIRLINIFKPGMVPDVNVGQVRYIEICE